MSDVQDMFRRDREAWIEEARATARRLLVARQEITIEDVLTECPRPTHIHRNTTGSVFKHDDFAPCGLTKSRRTISRGRYVMKWRLNAEQLPVLMRFFRLRERNAE